MTEKVIRSLAACGKLIGGKLGVQVSFNHKLRLPAAFSWYLCVPISPPAGSSCIMHTTPCKKILKAYKIIITVVINF